jgi:ABC-type Fe3+ transport system substrate-binding protein
MAKRIPAKNVVSVTLGFTLGYVVVSLLSLCALAGDAKAAVPAEWNSLVEGAKREGQLNLYIGRLTWGNVMSSAFQKAYPEIKVTAAYGRDNLLNERIMTERRAGKNLADISMQGTTSNVQLLRANVLEPIRSALMLPDILDQQNWYGGKHQYMDHEGHVFLFVANSQAESAVQYHTKSVDPTEIKSYWDFVNPKWKGKMEARDVRTPGPGNGVMRFFYHTPELGPSFIKRLFSEMEITLYRDLRQGADWLATGKFAICFFCEIRQASEQGLPVAAFGALKEGAGVSVGDGALALLKDSVHPNAAKLFLNWFLSREGQFLFQTEVAKFPNDAVDSRRIDIPKDHVPKDRRRVAGFRYLDIDTPERRDNGPAMKIFLEALESARKS